MVVVVVFDGGGGGCADHEFFRLLAVELAGVVSWLTPVQLLDHVCK